MTNAIIKEKAAPPKTDLILIVSPWLRISLNRTSSKRQQYCFSSINRSKLAGLTLASGVAPDDRGPPAVTMGNRTAPANTNRVARNDQRRRQLGRLNSFADDSTRLRMS